MQRWIISPVNETTTGGRRYRRAQVATTIERLGGGMGYSAIMSNGQPAEVNDWCLCCVRVDDTDRDALDADPSLINVLEEDETGRSRSLVLLRTPAELNWSPTKQNRFRNKLESHGVDLTGLTLDDPLWRFIARLGRTFSPNWLPWGTYVPSPEARNLAQRPDGTDPGDTFVETSDTALLSHTPTGTGAGSGWTSEVNTTSTTLTVFGTTDSVGLAANATDSVIIVSLQPNPSGGEYDVQATAVTVSGVATAPWGLIGRYTDSSNFYAAGTLRAGDALDKKIAKTIGGTSSVLTENDFGLANGDVLLFQVRDATKKLFQNGVERLSSADNTLTSAGRVGMFWGAALATSTHDPHSSWKIDDFSYTEVGGGGGGVTSVQLEGALRGLNRGLNRGVVAP